MQLQDLLHFITIIDGRILKKYHSSTKSEEVFSKVVKLNEELGGLCNEILAASGMQSSEKLESFRRTKLPEEFASVLITTLLLAESMNVDIETALHSKMKSMNTQFHFA